MIPRVRLENLTKDFGQVRAVDQLSLTLSAGEIFAFLGLNGAGKTTTIKMLVGLLAPTKGSVWVDEMNLRDSPEEVKRIIGYVPDEPYLYDKLTATEYLNFIGTLFQIPENGCASRRDRLLENFGLRSVANRLIEGYSHGMRQRLVYASVLLHEPNLLVVDEPTLGLDPEGMKLIRATFRELAKEGKTVLLSTHVLSLAEAVADRIGIIHQGRLVACGTVKELIHDQPGSRSLEECFLRVVGSSSA